MTEPSRSIPRQRGSPRLRHSPSRPSGPEISVLKGADENIQYGTKRNGSTARLDDEIKVRRSSKRLREQQKTPQMPPNPAKKSEPTLILQSAGGRRIPMRSVRNRPSSMRHGGYNTNRASNAKGKNRNGVGNTTDKKNQLMGSGSHRPPRVIIIGAGIAGLACARELSERKHDVLVLEARNRLGGRLRTIDLMMDDAETVRVRNEEVSDEQSELFKVKKWSPIDVGGAFIHGTGVYSADDSHASHIGSHDFGTSKSSGDGSKLRNGQNKDNGSIRKSKRLLDSSSYQQKMMSKSNINIKRADSSSLMNPIYSLAQKLRLPLHAAAGANVFLVDHNGAKINDDLDESVSRDFNAILDLATKCCESGRYTWKASIDGGEENVDSSDATISPGDDFAYVFEECKKHHFDTSSEEPEEFDSNEAAVRKNLFQWHISNLEMSSGAPMEQLGQKWNNDEPFGYGGDHSYLECGTREIIEALVEGFDCRGVYNQSILASGFGKAAATDQTSLTRGIIQCGIEVNGIEVVERGECKERRRYNWPVANSDESKFRRSHRSNKGNHTQSESSSQQNRRQVKAPSSSSTYGNQQSTVVNVTTTCGLTLQADAVVVSLPLAILSIPKGSPGHIAFNPPLPPFKKKAIDRLGVGTYNKCCMSFEQAFWNNLLLTSKSDERVDFIGHAAEVHAKNILFLSMKNSTILVAIYGGSEYSKKVETMHDEDVVRECMEVLKKMCISAQNAQNRKTRHKVNDIAVPDWPIDYFVSRWGSDPYSRGAFSYIPPGVNGFDELSAMSQPVYDFYPETMHQTPDERPKRPLLCFAGEATTPYHPSTIHGAFESGIREAYRIDSALEPDLSGVKFNDSYIYKPTFFVRRNLACLKATPVTTAVQHASEPSAICDWTFDNDISILRGVESFGCSFEDFAKIKSKIMASDDTRKTTDLMNRHKFLRSLLDDKSIGWDISDWTLCGGSWLATGVSQAKKRKAPVQAKKVAASQLKLLSDIKVGTKLDILWPDDDTYYTGVIKTHHSMLSGKYGSYYEKEDNGFVYTILYEDGSVETVDLAREKFRIIDDSDLSTRRSSRNVKKKRDASFEVN